MNRVIYRMTGHVKLVDCTPLPLSSYVCQDVETVISINSSNQVFNDRWMYKLNSNIQPRTNYHIQSECASPIDILKSFPVLTRTKRSSNYLTMLGFKSSFRKSSPTLIEQKRLCSSRSWNVVINIPFTKYKYS